MTAEARRLAPADLSGLDLAADPRVAWATSATASSEWRLHVVWR